MLLISHNRLGLTLADCRLQMSSGYFITPQRIDAACPRPQKSICHRPDNSGSKAFYRLAHQRTAFAITAWCTCPFSCLKNCIRCVLYHITFDTRQPRDRQTPFFERMKSGGISALPRLNHQGHAADSLSASDHRHPPYLLIGYGAASYVTSPGLPRLMQSAGTKVRLRPGVKPISTFHAHAPE